MRLDYIPGIRLTMQVINNLSHQPSLSAPERREREAGAFRPTLPDGKLGLRSDEKISRQVGTGRSQAIVF